MKQLLGEELAVDSRNIHAFIIGEHGDSELAVWSGANVSGIDLDQFCQLRGGVDNCHLDQLYRRVRDSAYEIIRRKGATYYGIAMAVGRIAQCLVRDEHSVLPVSVVLEGQYGLEGLALSIPSCRWAERPGGSAGNPAERGGASGAGGLRPPDEGGHRVFGPVTVTGIKKPAVP